MKASFETFCGAVVFGMGFVLGGGLIVLVLRFLASAVSQNISIFH